MIIRSFLPLMLNGLVLVPKEYHESRRAGAGKGWFANALVSGWHCNLAIVTIAPVMPTERFFKQLQKDLLPFRGLMARAAEVITDQDVSSYPVMVAAEILPNIGINIVDREKHASRWYINASTLEELVVKNIVDSARVEDFKLVYRQSAPQLCLLVITADQAHFIFMPKTETSD